MIRRSIVNVEQLDERLCLSSTPVMPMVVEPLETRAVCHGTTVLAWARVDGTSPVSQQGNYFNGRFLRADDLRAEQTTDQVFASQPARTTVADDVIVDGQIITGENPDVTMHGYIKIKKLNSGG